MKRFLIPCMVALLGGCNSLYPPHDKSAQNRIGEELKQAAAVSQEKAAGAVLPPSVSSSLLPPLRSGMPKASSRQLEQRFDLVMTDAPINQVLMAIVSDTRYSILLSPKTIPPGPAAAAQALIPGQVVAGTSRATERLTVNLKDVTVFESLDAIRELYGYEYTVDGTRIYVQPPELKTSLYQVNYILGQRRGVSDLQVIGGASSGSSSGSSSGTGGSTGASSGTSGTSGSGTTGGSYSSIQASALSTISKSDVWGEMEDAIRTVLGCQIAKSQPKNGGTSSSSNSTRADVSFVGETQAGEQLHGVDGCSDGRAMTVNQTSGTILVRGMPKELRLIENLLHSMQINIERQVIIEAKIIDVELNSDSQQGINWAGFNKGWHQVSVGANTSLIDGTKSASAGSINPGTSLGGLLGTQVLGTAAPNAFSAGLGVALQFTNFSALINFLQTQGQVHVLSSPRIATLNNQKAVLKVGSEESFVTNASGGQITAGTGGSPSTVSNPTITYQPFFSGISLDVTPQIDDADRITLHVHSMVNSIAVKDKLAIISASGDRSLPFAVNSISETDSVVKTKDGQVIVIGGLMTESGTDNRSKIPGLGDVPGAGALFSNGGQQTVKRELVILLKPTVVKGDNAWSDDIAATQGRMQRMETTAAPDQPRN
jgi:MSHA biogenesis protein MshL